MDALSLPWVKWGLLVAMLVFAVLAAGVGMRAAEAGARDEFESASFRSPAGHLRAFLLWVIVVLFTTVALVISADIAFPSMRETLFSEGDDAHGLGPGDVLSILSLVTGVPIAFAGSLYAIYLAILGLRGSSHQKRLAEQANRFSDPAYHLSQRAYNGYRRFDFLVGALLAASRIERQAKENAAYEGRNPVAKGAASEIMGKLHALLLDEAFSVAALEAAKCYGRMKPEVGELVAAHQLRSAFARLMGLLEGVRGLTLNSDSMTPLMAGVYGLDQQIKQGRHAVIDLVKNRELTASDDDSRFLSYLAGWMGRIGDAEVGRDLERNARVLVEGELTLQNRPGPEELVQSTLSDLLREPSNLGQKTSRTLPIVPAVRIRASLGDFQLIASLMEVSRQVGSESGFKVHVHEFSQVEPTRDCAQDVFHVMTCNMDSFERVVQGIPLYGGFKGILIVDGIRSEGAVHVERSVLAYENVWAELGRGVAPTRPTTLVDAMKGLQPIDRLEESGRFLAAYGSNESGQSGRLLLVGIDYFDYRKGGEGIEVDELLKVEHVFNQQGSSLTSEMKQIAGL